MLRLIRVTDEAGTHRHIVGLAAAFAAAAARGTVVRRGATDLSTFAVVSSVLARVVLLALHPGSAGAKVEPLEALVRVMSEPPA